MTRLLLGALVACAIAALGEGYVIFGRMQLFLTAAEQILAALQVPLRDVASKSAGRTIAPAGLMPRRWFQTLRRLADVTAPNLAEEQLEVDDVVVDQVDDELARWEDDGGTPDNTPTDTMPAVTPATEPMDRIDVAGGIRLPAPAPDPGPDVVDPWRDRFTFATGGRRR